MDGAAASALQHALSGYLSCTLLETEFVEDIQKSLLRARGRGDWLHHKVRRITSSEILPNQPPLLANPIQIRQMLDNLVGNAKKYTPMACRVFIPVSMQGNQIVLQIEDTGSGIES